MFEVDAAAAFDVGVREGRCQMARHVLEILEVTDNVEFIRKHIELLVQEPERRKDIKGFFETLKSKNSDNV